MACVAEEGGCGKGGHVRRVDMCVRETATDVGVTHSTGMHSCFGIAFDAYGQQNHLCLWLILSEDFCFKRKMTVKDRFCSEVLLSRVSNNWQVHTQRNLWLVTFVNFLTYTGLGIRSTVLSLFSKRSPTVSCPSCPCATTICAGLFTLSLYVKYGGANS